MSLGLAVVIQLHANHFVPGWNTAVPGAVKSYEYVVAILGRKHVCRVEEQIQRRRVRLHHELGGDGLRALVCLTLRSVAHAIAIAIWPAEVASVRA